MKSLFRKFAVAALTTTLFAAMTPAKASVVIDDSIQNVTSGLFKGWRTYDHWTVDLEAGDYVFDLEAANYKGTAFDGALFVYGPGLGLDGAFGDDRALWLDGEYNTRHADPRMNLSLFGGTYNIWVASSPSANATFLPGLKLEKNFNNFGGAYNKADAGKNLYYRLSINEVPEPATVALLGAGLVGFGLARRRRA